MGTQDSVKFGLMGNATRKELNASDFRRLAEYLRQFEGREAIYVEKSIRRVRICNIQLDGAGNFVTADVEELPTAGLPVMAPNHFRNFPSRWKVGTPIGDGAYLASSEWGGAIYSGWSVFFNPEIVAKVVSVAASFPPDLHPMLRYYKLLTLVRQPHRASELTS